MFLNTALYKINYTPLIFFSWGSSLYGLSGSPKYNLHMNRQVMLRITTAFMLFHHDIYIWGRPNVNVQMFSIELFLKFLQQLPDIVQPGQFKILH